MITVTRALHFDAGHRIPDHKSQCRNMHGHRYTLEITLSGPVSMVDGAPDRGMVIDFSDVKAIAKALIVDVWDHAFLVYSGDTVVRTFLDSMADHKTVVLDRIPTAENLVQIAFDTLAAAYLAQYGDRLKLTHARLYETPNCWADCYGPQP
ncbi:MAG: 6-carboxytetrahydropterin synthase QueD [Advenella sp.]